MRSLLPSWATVLLYATTTSAQNISSQDATEFALLYGYPLLAFQKASAVRVQQFGVNELAYARALSNATAKQVVKPNADTLYGNVVYDLSQDDVAITIPEIPDDTFCLFSFYDPFGDNWANIGTGNSAGAGEYRLRIRRTDYGVQLANDASGNTPNYINSPSLHGILLVRWLVNATNLDAVHAHQDATKVEGVPKENRSLRGTSLSMLNWNMGNSTPAEHVLNLLAQFSPSLHAHRDLSKECSKPKGRHSQNSCQNTRSKSYIGTAVERCRLVACTVRAVTSTISECGLFRNNRILVASI